MMSIKRWSVSRVQHAGKVARITEKSARLGIKIDMKKTDFLTKVIYGEEGVQGKSNEESENKVEQNEDGVKAGNDNFNNKWENKNDCLLQDSMSDRLNALEMSEELRAIYSHPQWQEFLAVLYRSRCPPATTAYSAADLDTQVRTWALQHPHINQLLGWFHQCTARYGLTFDPFASLPASRAPVPELDCEDKVSNQKNIQLIPSAEQLAVGKQQAGWACQQQAQYIPGESAAQAFYFQQAQPYAYPASYYPYGR